MNESPTRPTSTICRGDFAVPVGRNDAWSKRSAIICMPRQPIYTPMPYPNTMPKPRPSAGSVLQRHRHDRLPRRFPSAQFALILTAVIVAGGLLSVRSTPTRCGHQRVRRRHRSGR